jgi:hypothetical protein
MSFHYLKPEAMLSQGIRDSFPLAAGRRNDHNPSTIEMRRKFVKGLGILAFPSFSTPDFSTPWILPFLLICAPAKPRIR